MKVRKYAAPPPMDHLQGQRTKDDLHEWSIYRQNLTSSIARNVLNHHHQRRTNKNNNKILPGLPGSIPSPSSGSSTVPVSAKSARKSGHHDHQHQKRPFVNNGKDGLLNIKKSSTLVYNQQHSHQQNHQSQHQQSLPSLVEEGQEQQRRQRQQEQIEQERREEQEEEEAEQLTYGQFEMAEDAIDAVLRRGMEEDPDGLGGAEAAAGGGAGGDNVYLRFGLPRISLPQGGGHYGLYRQGSNFRQAATATGTTDSRPPPLPSSNRRKALSELDIRQAILNESYGGGSGAPAVSSSYNMNPDPHLQQQQQYSSYGTNLLQSHRSSFGRQRGERLYGGVGGGHHAHGHHNHQFRHASRLHAASSVDQGLDKIMAGGGLYGQLNNINPTTRHYALSDVQQYPQQPSTSAAAAAAAAGGGLPAVGQSAGQQQQYPFDVHDFGQPSHSSDEAEDALYSGFLNSKRHHQHYFSNLDLFSQQLPQASTNYLRYAKAEDLNPVISRTPRLTLRNIGFQKDRRSQFDTFMLRSPNYKRILDGINMELLGGETLALMYTSEEEIQTLMTILSNAQKLKGRREGAVFLNGIGLRPPSLWKGIAYVQREEPYPNLTVREHLQLCSMLVKPATTAFRTNSMISQLVQTLALSPFQNRLIGQLGYTEKQRLKVAAKILMDTDVILLDDICRGMDLYDSAFLIDYLRDWASKLNRIVIMAINPPSYQLLAMFLKAGIIASGRLLYVGPSAEIVDYFEDFNFPSPVFKNPCDYFVDLVTKDHLSMEASMESSERIRRLADVWTTEKGVLPPRGGDNGGGGPGSGPPPPLCKPVNPIMAIFILYWREWVIMCNNGWPVVSELVYAVLIGVLLATLFFSLTLGHAAGITDRFGLFYALLTLGLLPNVWMQINRVHSHRRLLHTDFRCRKLYSPISYYVAKLLFDIPLGILSYALYSTPVYFLAGLQPVQYDGGLLSLGLYLSITVLYGLTVRYMAWLNGYVWREKSSAMIGIGIWLSVISVLGGVTVHPSDVWFPFRRLAFLSPTRWAVHLLSQREFYGNLTAPFLSPAAAGKRSGPLTQLSFKCASKTILENRQGFEIQTATLCNNTLGSTAWRWAQPSIWPQQQIFGGPEHLYTVGFVAISLWAILTALLNVCCIYCNHPARTKIKRRNV